MQLHSTMPLEHRQFYRTARIIQEAAFTVFIVSLPMASILTLVWLALKIF